MHDLSFELTNLATKRCQAESAFHCESFANSPFRVLPVLVSLLLPLLLLCDVALPGVQGRAFLSSPTQPPMVACKRKKWKLSQNMSTLHTHLCTFSVPTWMLSRRLVTKFLSRSSGGSLLGACCWLGKVIHFFYIWSYGRY